MMDFQLLIFLFLAILTLGAAFSVVFLRNIVHSTLSLIACFLGVATIFLTMDADFLAAVQVLIYAGAISMLIVFGVMIITREEGNMQETNPFGEYKIIAGVLAMMLLGIVSYFIINTNWNVAEGEEGVYSVASIADLFLSNHLIAFELAALLLTVAMVGAILIAKEVKKQ